MRRTVPPSAEIQVEIDKLLSKGSVDDPQKMLGELGRLGARQLRLGVAQRVPPAARAHGGGRAADRGSAGSWAVVPFVSKLFPKWRCKRLLRTGPLKVLVIGGFVGGLSTRNVESLCEEAGLGTSRSTIARICAELHERFAAFCRRSLYDVSLVVLIP